MRWKNHRTAYCILGFPALRASGDVRRWFSTDSAQHFFELINEFQTCIRF